MNRTRHFSTHDRTPLGRAILSAVNHRLADTWGNVTADLTLSDWVDVKRYIRRNGL